MNKCLILVIELYLSKLGVRQSNVLPNEGENTLYTPGCNTETSYFDSALKIWIKEMTMVIKIDRMGH